MASSLWSFATPCGHSGTVKPCRSKRGPHAGKWVVKVSGPTVHTKTGFKTKYCAPDESSARTCVASAVGLEDTGGASVDAASVVMLRDDASSSSTTTTKTSATTATSRTLLAAPLSSSPPPPSTTSVATVDPPSVVDDDGAPVPTPEQTSIVDTLAPPRPRRSNGAPPAPPRVVRVTAGAGAGKTTTVLRVAARAAELGHRRVTYLTFGRAAAADGRRRVEEELAPRRRPGGETVVVEASTLHARAMRLLRDRRGETGDDETDERTAALWDDDRLTTFVERACANDVDAFLAHARLPPVSDAARSDVLDACRRQVVFFVKKTLTTFCRSANSLEQFRDPTFKYRHYYPAKMFHEKPQQRSGVAGGEGGLHNHFPQEVYRHKVGDYADMAVRVWEEAETRNVRTYDLEMKRAQLCGLRLPPECTLLLVDESQDLDACQTDWIRRQAVVDVDDADDANPVDTYLVGDAAQTIYSFRGARSRNVTNLDLSSPSSSTTARVRDRSLTRSFRFGERLARAANLVLFAKERSPQTTANRFAPVWRPYRVVGGGAHPGAVTADRDAFLRSWRETPDARLTVIAAANATLLLTAVELFGTRTTNDGNEPRENENEARPITDETTTRTEETTTRGTNNVVADSVASEPVAASTPKIHVNGKGENSGMNKWRAVLRQIDFIHDLYASGDDGAVLPRDKFSEFNGRRLTWNSFLRQVEAQEINRLFAAVSVVQTFQDKTKEAMDVFQREVVDKNYDADEANIVLTTCHAAKGMEWDHCLVCDDFLKELKVVQSGPITTDPRTNRKRSTWQFDTKSYGDDVNMLYVACTRAKKSLCVPSCVQAFLSDCDALHDMILARKDLDPDNTKTHMCLFHRKDPLTTEDAFNLYDDLVSPLRQQYHLSPTDKLESTVVSSSSSLDEHDETTSSPVSDVAKSEPNVEVRTAPTTTTTTSTTTSTTNVGVAASSAAAAVVVKSEPSHLPMVEAVTSNANPRPALPTTGACAAVPVPSEPSHLAVVEAETSHANPRVRTDPAPPTAVAPVAAPRVFQLLEEAKKVAALLPKGTKRPFDKFEKSPTGKAKCRHCGQLIAEGSWRAGVQVYQPDKREFWASYFHTNATCFPKGAKELLRFDPNPKKRKNNNGNGGGGRYYKKQSYNNNHQGGYYKNPWIP